MLKSSQVRSPYQHFKLFLESKQNNYWDFLRNKGLSHDLVKQPEKPPKNEDDYDYILAQFNDVLNIKIDKQIHDV